MKNKKYLEPEICGRGSDYGYYGKTGKYIPKNLNLELDDEGDLPILKCEYDETVGFRETVYYLYSKNKRHLNTYYSSRLEDVIEEWNNKMKKRRKKRLK